MSAQSQSAHIQPAHHCGVGADLDGTPERRNSTPVSPPAPLLWCDRPGRKHRTGFALATPFPGLRNASLSQTTRTVWKTRKGRVFVLSPRSGVWHAAVHRCTGYRTGDTSLRGDRFFPRERRQLGLSGNL